MENDLQGVIWEGVQTQASRADAEPERRVSTGPGREKAGAITAALTLLLGNRHTSLESRAQGQVRTAVCKPAVSVAFLGEEGRAEHRLPQAAPEKAALQQLVSL